MRSAVRMALVDIEKLSPMEVATIGFGLTALVAVNEKLREPVAEISRALQLHCLTAMGVRFIGAVAEFWDVRLEESVARRVRDAAGRPRR